MRTYDKDVVRLLVAAKNFVSKNNAMTFAADIAAETALRVADGDTLRAIDLLRSVEEFSREASQKLQQLRQEPSLICVPFDTIPQPTRRRPSNDEPAPLLDRLSAHRQPESP